jgi:hypothetical protein
LSSPEKKEMSNRVTLEQALEMSIKEVSMLPVSQLALLQEDVAELKASTKKADDFIYAALAERFAGKASEQRKAKGQDTGTVRFDDGEYTVVADLPKKVTYDQSGLRQVETQINAMGEPIEDYISIKRDVSERAFEGWPNSLKKMFLPYRTVGVGKAGYKLVKKEA